MSSTYNLRSAQRRQEGFTNLSNDVEMDPHGSAGHEPEEVRI